MVDVQIHFSTKICEYGIKKFIICNKLMAVLDSESNIHLFDIVRKESDSEISEIDIESLEEYCSDAWYHSILIFRASFFTKKIEFDHSDFPIY